ncbi:hypothetical protein ES705_02386 [subsurface metagenome]
MIGTRGRPGPRGRFVGLRDEPDYLVSHPLSPEGRGGNNFVEDTNGEFGSKY